MTVTALPPNGTVLLADGFTPVHLRQALPLAELGTLKFMPALSSTAGSPGFGSCTTNPAGAVVDAEAGLPAGYSVLSVPRDSGARTIGIQIFAGSDYPASESYAIITGLPPNGAVLLADGTTAVTRGQTLTAAELKRLRFRPAIDAVGQISTMNYLVVGPPGGPVAGCVLLIVAPATPPLSATGRSPPAPASVAESSIVAPAGAAAPSTPRSIPMALRTEKDEKHVLPRQAPTYRRAAEPRGPSAPLSQLETVGGHEMSHQAPTDVRYRHDMKRKVRRPL
jgi:hypothetical protein